jgi:uncharacterized coiled-coil protein SlyX
MTRTTRSSSSSEELPSPSSVVDNQGLSTVIHDLSLRMTNNDTRVEHLDAKLDSLDNQFKDFSEKLTTLVDKFDKIQHLSPAAQATSQSTPTRQKK